MSPEPRSWLLEHLRASFGMTDDDAHSVADMVLDLFDDAHQLNDDDISPDVRSLLYELEAHRILLIHRFEYAEEETGRILRGYIWSFNLELEPPRAREADAMVDDVYAELPANAWARGQIA